MKLTIRLFIGAAIARFYIPAASPTRIHRVGTVHVPFLSGSVDNPVVKKIDLTRIYLPVERVVRRNDQLQPGSSANSSRRVTG